MLRRVLPLICAAWLLAGPVLACFGPKLYVGVDSGAEQETLYALVALYLKEKTGIDTERVDLAGRDPLAELQAERLDLVFAGAGGDRVLLDLPGFPRLHSGRRPLVELQFTTVAPALRKLAGRLSAAQLQELVAQVRAGAPPAATARRFLTAQGWL